MAASAKVVIEVLYRAAPDYQTGTIRCSSQTRLDDVSSAIVPHRNP